MDVLSVVIPTYKPEDYLFNLIIDLRNQTLSSDRFKVLIILNGPRDPFYNKIKNWISGWSNFFLIYSDIKGVSAARNLGIQLTEGKYLSFIDDDDSISKNYLEELFEKAKITDSDIVQSNFKAIKGQEVNDDYISNAFSATKDQSFNLIKYRKFLSSVCGKIFKMSLLSKAKFDTSLEVAEDAVFLFSLSPHIKKMSLTSDTCIYYRNIRDGSSSRKRLEVGDVLAYFWKKLSIFSKIYFNDPRHFNFIFYLNRILAIVKILIMDLYKIVFYSK